MNEKSQPDQLKNAILVFETENGGVDHCYCSTSDANERLNQAVSNGSAGSIFTCDEHEAEFIYAVSPSLRDRIDEAKRKLRSDIILRDAMNRHAVPADRDLRIKIKNAIDDIRSQLLQPVF